MLKNYLLSSWRNLWRQKTFSTINIFGLALGIACCLALLSFVKQEFSYDEFHSEADNIFRVVQDVQGDKDYAWTGGAVGPMMIKEFDEVEKAVRIHQISTYLRPAEGPNSDESFRESKFTFADDGFFDIFSFPLVSGSHEGAMAEPFTIFLTEDMANKYFGDQDPIGKELISTGEFAFTVRGVIKNLPSNTHLDFDFVTAMASFKATEGYPLTAEFASFWWPYCYTYVKLKDPRAAIAINGETLEASKKYRPEEEAKAYVPYLQPIQDIHLNRDISGELKAGTPKSTVYIFLSIGIFILLLACINFINLATARATKRMREIGVRKVNGAVRAQLVLQFFIESFLINFFALAMSLVLLEGLRPVFGHLLQQEIQVLGWQNPQTWIFLGGILFISTVLSGLFPAVYLSGLKPNLILKNTAFSSSKSNVRQGLVVVQFALSGILVFCATIAYFQHMYMADASLGFAKENILSVSMGEVSRANRAALTTELETLPYVKNVAGSSIRPGVDTGWSPRFTYEGISDTEKIYIHTQYIDHGYFSMIGVPLVAGREFDESINDKGDAYKIRDMFPGVKESGLVINESAAALMGVDPDDALGKPIRMFTEENGQLFSDLQGRVVGVVKDYHTTDLRNPIVPTVFAPVQNDHSDNSSHLIIKMDTDRLPEAIAGIGSVWKKIVPAIPFEYSLLEDSILAQYEKEQRLSNLLGLFALLTLLVSCLGLLGLSIFMAEARKKEIGVRKVLGASEISIVQQLTTDFLKPVMVATIIALPLGYYIMGEWLTQFAIQVEVNIWFFMITALLAIAVAWMTVAVQSWRAAISNPVDSLRSE